MRALAVVRELVRGLGDRLMILGRSVCGSDDARCDGMSQRMRKLQANAAYCAQEGV